MSKTVVIFLALIIAISGCRGKTEQPGRSEEAAPASAIHASAGVVPGSYEDWCLEHQVPESGCTRCDASLVPAFKATNDWCAEHGLPESQCLACDPNLKIVRPAQGEGR